MLQSTNLMDIPEVAKDSNQGIGERATAAKDALGNKMDEQQHEVGILPCCLSSFLNITPQAKSTADKEAAKH